VRFGPAAYTTGVTRGWIYFVIVLLSIWIVANVAFAMFVAPEPIVPNDDLTEDFI
jgi:hypothetical protein